MEVWIKAKEFPDYEVSSEGRIRNPKTNRILKTTINEKGYERLTLRKDNKQVNAKVHRVVADSFYDGDHEGLDVNHIDGVKNNNKISNLEFCTRSENVIHAFKNNLKQPSRQMRVKVIETGKEYESIRQCARELYCNQSDICKCLNGQQQACGGYHFARI